MEEKKEDRLQAPLYFLKLVLRSFTLSLILTGCARCSTAGYLLRQLPGQVDLLSKKIPVDEVIADPSTSPELRRTLQLSIQAKRFAHEHIGLKKNRNYTEYKDLKRDFVILSLVASPKLKLEAHSWSYPFFGKFPYLGFFSEQEAKDEAIKFKEKGFDTSIRKVSAYSTLGWFRDAILNTMTDSPIQLVETIIHEQMHATVYHKDRGTFNENIALFVGIQGSLEFLETLEEKEWPEKRDWAVQLKSRGGRQAKVNGWVKEAKDQLGKLYENPNKSNEEKLIERETIFTSLQDRWKKTINPNGIDELNNAFIVSLGTYTDNYEEMEMKFKKLGSLKSFVQWAKENPPPQAE